jgi:SAM-dependent methyltransferase
MLAFITQHLRQYPRIWKAAKLLRNNAQFLVWFALDVSEALLGRRDPLTPPRRLMNVGSDKFTRSDFNEIGNRLFQYLVDIGGLKPNDKVLDVGCGVGRMAIPLTRYLSSEGTYDGFDIVRESIEHCTRTYPPRFRNFHFHHADIYNVFYNPHGKYLSHQYRFPFPDTTFSFLLLNSVFTHMLSNGVESYLNEIHRVLIPGGRCFITYFLLNEDSEDLLRSDRSHLKFVFPIEHGKVLREECPEEAVAFDETYIRVLYQKSHLSIVEPVRYGSWSGRNTEVGYQDIIVGVAE